MDHFHTILDKHLNAIHLNSSVTNSGNGRRKPFSLKSFAGYEDNTQSFSIKVGTALENALREWVFSQPGVSQVPNIERSIIRTTRKDGHMRQLDLLFRLDNTLYYREIKANVQLDSEKSRAMVEKVMHIKQACPTESLRVSVKTLAILEPDLEVSINPVFRPILESNREFFELFGVDAQNFQAIIAPLIKKHQQRCALGSQPIRQEASELEDVYMEIFDEPWPENEIPAQ